jgi:hypothetical protein
LIRPPEEWEEFALNGNLYRVRVVTTGRTAEEEARLEEAVKDGALLMESELIEEHQGPVTLDP